MQIPSGFLRGVPESEPFRTLRHQALDTPLWGEAVRFGLGQIGSVAGLTVADMGCGPGVHSVLLALQGAKVIGFDIDAAALEQAKQLATRCGVQNACCFMRCLGEQIAVASSSADLVFSRSTLQYMDRQRALGECLRIVKPGGTLLLLENLPHNPFVNMFRTYRRMRARRLGNTAYVDSIRGYLTWVEIHSLRHCFESLRWKAFHLVRPISLGLHDRHPNSRCVKLLDETLGMLDRTILTCLPPLRRMAWFVAIVAKGKKEPCGASFAPTAG